MKNTIASYIDHTLLKPESTEEEITMLCDEAKEYKFKTVCINPYWVKTARAILEGSDVGITTRIGYAIGASTTKMKGAERKDASVSGATEKDMVINIGKLKLKNNDAVKSDIASVVEAADSEAIVKVIIETGILTNDEKVRACELSKLAGANFVNKSTLFSY